jgi:cell division transport system permease protein
MSSYSEKAEKRRLLTSYFTSVLSVALVLFMASLIGILILNSSRLSTYVKENLGFSVVINDSIAQPEIIRLQKECDASKAVKSTRYITPEMAAVEMKDELGEDFIQFVGYNPLPSVIEIRFNAQYTHPDSLVKFEQRLLQNKIVQQVRYEKSLAQLVNENVRKLSLIILTFGLLFFIVSWVLVNNTVRLAISSRRFVIHTMQLVGATKGFIRRPFLFRSVLQGLVASMLAIGFVVLLFYFGEREVPELSLLIDDTIFLMVFASVAALGIIIHIISTYFAVSRYLRMKEDDLYLV